MFSLEDLAGIKTAKSDKLSYKKGVFAAYKKKFGFDSDTSVRNFIRKNVIQEYLEKLISTKNKEEFKDFWEWHFNNAIDFSIIPNSKNKDTYAELIKKAENVYNSIGASETEKKNRKK